MPEVNVLIDGRSYGISCDYGQEARVQQLGRYVDQKIRTVTGGDPNANKSQSIVLASLILADEVFELSERIEKSPLSNPNSQPQTTEPSVVYEGMAPEEEQKITSVIAHLASKVEKLKARAQKA